MIACHKLLLRLCLIPLILVIKGCGGGPLIAVSDPVRSPSTRLLTVLYTNDEHGWMEGATPAQGAANLYGLWVQQEGYTPDGPFLVLSGGDNWTGPAISTTVAGASMVEVMNRMHYDASAVGNHEFDFGLEVLSQRIAEANYPYLSANTRWRETNQIPVDLGIQPYTIVAVNDVRVGIIGLTTTSTPRTTNPVNVAALEFMEYEQAVRATVPQVRAEGVDLLFLIAHVCIEPLRQLAAQIADLDIQLIGGGHCNELSAEQTGNLVLLSGGSRFTTYAKAQFNIDLQGKQIVSVNYSTHANQSGTPDPNITAVIQGWQDQVAGIMSVVIGYNAALASRRNPVLEQTFVDSWLHAFPAADIAISNPGGIRADLPAGDVTVGDLFGMLPFDNTIVTTTLNGAVLKQVLNQAARPLVAGLVQQGEAWFEQRSGAEVSDSKIYTVLVNSFMYAGGETYQTIADFDPQGFDTGINYRQPFVDWVRSQQSSVANPLQLQAAQ